MSDLNRSPYVSRSSLGMDTQGKMHEHTAFTSSVSPLGYRSSDDVLIQYVNTLQQSPRLPGAGTNTSTTIANSPAHVGANTSGQALKKNILGCEKPFR